METFLTLPHGIPSHDTFNRFFSALDPKEFEACFSKWVASIYKRTRGEVISLDGKTMCGARYQGCKSATHIVSAWADKNEMILGQIKVDEKSNEITAIPQLLDTLLLEGGVVTIDAMGCQKSIVKKIVKKKADYILAVKENQKELYEDVLDSFRGLPAIDSHHELDFGNGRIETRICSILTDLSLVFGKGMWKKLTSIIKIERVREFKATGKIQTETSYYISSLNQAKEIGLGIRKHWGIENKVHWTLDVVLMKMLLEKELVMLLKITRQLTE